MKVKKETYEEKKQNKEKLNDLSKENVRCLMNLVCNFPSAC